jgi:hypothetical protein
MWFTDVQAMKGEISADLLRVLPERQPLRQGRKDVSDQFQYSSVVTTEGRRSVFWGEFRSALALAAVKAIDRSEFLERNAAAHDQPSTGVRRRDGVVGRLGRSSEELDYRR